jgi:hypothetical protein
MCELRARRMLGLQGLPLMGRGRAPKLGIVSLVNTPPAQVAKMLQPMRGYAEEVVLAADNTVPADWIAGYRRLADKVLVVPFPGAFAPMYQWLCRQCSAAWILCIHADEIPSCELGPEIIKLVDSGEVTHARVARQWLTPDGRGLLSEPPWSTDFPRRLHRNDPAILTFPGKPHEDSVVIAGAQAVLRAPIYHADLALTDTDTRKGKCARYELLAPGMRYRGRSFNEAWYLPESLARQPEQDSIPAIDKELVDAFIRARHTSLGASRFRARRFRPGRVIRIEQDEALDMTMAGTGQPSPHHGSVRFAQQHLSLEVSQPRAVILEVTNMSERAWPGNETAEPLIRIGVRWVSRATGEVRDTQRVAFLRTVEPGATICVLAEELAVPAQPGEYELEFQLVHELVCWFGAVESLCVTVQPGQPPAVSGASAKTSVT